MARARWAKHPSPAVLAALPPQLTSLLIIDNATCYIHLSARQAAAFVAALGRPGRPSALRVLELPTAWVRRAPALVPALALAALHGVTHLRLPNQAAADMRGALSAAAARAGGHHTHLAMLHR